MPVYSYTLTTFQGRSSDGYFTAEDIETVLQILRGDEVAVIYVEELKEEDDEN